MALVWWVRGPHAGYIGHCPDDQLQIRMAWGECQPWGRGPYAPPQIGTKLRAISPEVAAARQSYKTTDMTAAGRRNGRSDKAPPEEVRSAG